MIAAGIMIGSSLDAIDVVAIDVESLSLIEAIAVPFDDGLKTQTLAVVQGQAITAYELGVLKQQWSWACIHALKALKSPIDLIGVHGPTIAHAPNDAFPFSWQLIDAVTLNEHLKIPVVSDFRQRDVASGGQGAPLAPLFHQALLPKETEAVINLGGVANVTLLHPQPIGFDIGPANALLDELAMKHLNKSFDEGGQWALSGQCQPRLLSALMQEPYIRLSPPKSTGRCYFNLKWLSEYTHDEQPCDVANTLCYWVAHVLAPYLKECRLYYFCGGGVFHGGLMKAFREVLGHPCPSTDEVGVPAQWLEAMGFAWLAAMRFQKKHLAGVGPVTGGHASYLGEVVMQSLA